HPTLGDVEIGGFNPKFYAQNPPPDLLETWARNEAMFNLYLAQQLPQVRIVSATSTPSSTAGVFDVELVVTNEGKMPTALEMAKRVKMVRPDTATITLSTRQALVQPAAGVKQPAQRTAIEIDWLKPGETRRVTWQVSGTGEARVSIGSTRGGLDSRTLPLK
ncbi:MAG TPA: hypothetical protein VNJ03_16635, partial [Vicinamibacterales bacterium]|nr:hypothetical protein [Vicinamibacterales bacterium]